MSAFRQIIVRIASGPGIASPNIDFFVLARADLNDADAHHVDRLIAEAGFFDLHETKPLFDIADGPHRSSITIDMTDGRTHTLAMPLSGMPASLLPIIQIVQERGPAPA